jgi:hypothetical protein
LLDALDAWATTGTPPPESRVPRRGDGTLVTAEAVRQVFPHIEGVECPAEPNRLFVQKDGADFAPGRSHDEPPQVDTTHEYAVLVPCIDADGNDVPGVRAPDLMVPLATYTGWNVRLEGAGGKAMYSIVGSYMPFAATEAERQKQRDVRPALSERYHSHADYVARVAHATWQLMEQRLLLPEDAARYMQAAMQTDMGSW